MPDSKGKLTPEEIQRALKVVNEVWTRSIPCEMCGTKNKWIIGEYTTAPPLITSDGDYILHGSFFYPQIPVFCQKCGNTKFLNGYISGIILRQEKKDG